MIYLYVALGGAFGAMARYGLGAIIITMLGTGFPYATLFVNVLGSFLMGALIETFALVSNPSAIVQIFLTTGVLGAFTTFSTFSLDFISLYERGEIMSAFIYLTCSVVLSIAALFVGLSLIRFFAG